METRKVIVSNKSGFHVRPAAKFSRFAEDCSSHVDIVYKGNVINAKSILNIVSKAISKGEEIEIRCVGPDEKKDLEYMVEAMKHIEE